MKQNIIRRSPRRAAKASPEPITIGMDLGDKVSCYCLLNQAGDIVKEGKLATTRQAMAQTFGPLERCRIVIEVGGHSPWVSRCLRQLGHDPIVANARQVRLISQSSRKDDKLDQANAGAAGAPVVLVSCRNCFGRSGTAANRRRWTR